MEVYDDSNNNLNENEKEINNIEFTERKANLENGIESRW